MQKLYNSWQKFEHPFLRIADWSEDDSDNDGSFVTGGSNSVSPSSSAHSPLSAAAASILSTAHPKMAAPESSLHPRANLSESSIATSIKEAPCSLLEKQEEAELVLGPNREFHLSSKIASRLYAHQKKGLHWLWSLHSMQRGGILGDDMGLGKTLQCAAFLAGMLESRLLK